MLLMIAALLICLDLYCINLVVKYFNSKEVSTQKLHYSSSQNRVVEVGVWSLRFVVFQYLLLLNLNINLLRILTIFLFIVPTLIAVFLIIKISPNRLINRPFAIITFLLALLLWVASAKGEDSWDGSAYHLPIEFLAYKFGSLWNWQEFIYAQWQSSSIELSGAFYDTVFGTPRLGIVVNYVLAFYLILLIRDTFPKRWIFFILLLIGTPSFLQQLSTRYIDISIAILGVITFSGVYIYFQNSEKRYFIIWLLPTYALLLGSKISALLILIFQFFILLILCGKPTFFRKLHVWIALCFLSFLLGNLPIGLRNFVEFENPFYPYKSIFFSSGYFGYENVSSGLSNFYASQIGLTNLPSILLFVFQYFISPFLALLEILKAFMSGISILTIPEFFRVFIYDNRLGGFGTWFPILVLSLVVLSRTSRKLFFLLFLIALFAILPTSFHSRYYLGVGLLITIAFFYILAEKPLSRPAIVSLLLIVTPFATLNFGTFVQRNFVSQSFFQPVDRFANSLSTKINPGCKKSIHIGSGPWATTALFGPDLCNVPILSIPIGGALLDAQLGAPALESSDIDRVRSLLMEDLSLLIICSRPNGKDDPCSRIMEEIDIPNTHDILRKEISEALHGPKITTLDVVARQ